MAIDIAGENMKETKFVELSQEPTTIWVKKGTKKLLDSIAERKESYDDIIQRLIRENEIRKTELQQVRDSDGSKYGICRLKVSDVKTLNSRLALGKSGYIEFHYNKPEFPPDPDFRFNITYTKEVCGKNKLDKRLEIKLRAKSYLRIVENLIQSQVSPMFRIDEKHILDLDWWGRAFNKLGFSRKTFDHDIVYKLIEFGIVE